MNRPVGLPDAWPWLPLATILKPIDLKERRAALESTGTIYSLLSAQWYAKGIVLKQEVAGKDLKTAAWYQARPGDFAMLKIWIRHGSWGFVPDGLINPIVSSEYPLAQLERSQADQTYVKHWLSQSWIWQFIDRAAEGVGRRRIQCSEFLESVFIPLPPLPEQRAIARVLDTVEAARAATERALEAAEQLKRSLLQHLFAYGPVPVDQAGDVPRRETEIGSVPEGWEVVKLEDVARVASGTTPNRKDARYWAEGTVPWLTSTRVHDKVIEQADTFVTETAITECSLYTAKSGALVMAIVGQGHTRGRVAVLGIDSTISRHLAAIDPDRSRADPIWLHGYLSSRYDQLRAETDGFGSTRGAITIGYLRALTLPLPPLPVQQAIADHLADVDDYITTLTSKAEALDALFASLLSNLMTGAVRVPIEPQDEEGS